MHAMDDGMRACVRASSSSVGWPSSQRTVTVGGVDQARKLNAAPVQVDQVLQHG